MNYDDLIQKKMQKFSSPPNYSEEQEESYQSEDHLINMFNQATQKQKKMQLMCDEYEKEIKEQANKTKIDANSQKILLKKLEKQLNTLLDKYLQEDLLNLSNLEGLLQDIGLSDNQVIDDLWTLLTLNLGTDQVFGGFVFNVLVILLESQLTLNQAQHLITEAILVEIEDQEIPEELIDMVYLQEIVQKIFHKFKQTQFRKSANHQQTQQTQQAQSRQVSVKKQQSSPVKSKKQTDEKNRFEILYEHSKLLQDKRRTLESKIQDDPECSFKPTVNKVNGKTQNPFNRLYQNAVVSNHMKQQKREIVSKLKQEEEMSECTFKPKIIQKHEFNHKPVRGEEIIIERMNKARLMKKEKENYYEEQSTSLSNKNKITKMEPFRFNQQQKLNDRQIILNVDIKISKSKKVRITVREGDDIEQLIQNFAKVHQLNNEQIQICQDTIEQYL